MRKLLDLINSLSIDQWLLIAAAILSILVTLKALAWLLDKAYIASLPMTKFGFKGRLVYTDNAPQAKVFVNKRYQLSAKPDFVFRIGLWSYITVEFKSRNAPVKESDLIQLIATVIAVRSQYNIVRAMVVTNSETQEISIGSNSKLYSSIKQLHKQAKKVKHFNKEPKPLVNDARCKGCGYLGRCLSN
jgi:CRISPR/Cas system-associated exonuclease Cas4 (RecB family)